MSVPSGRLEPAARTIRVSASRTFGRMLRSSILLRSRLARSR